MRIGKNKLLALGSIKLTYCISMIVVDNTNKDKKMLKKKRKKLKATFV